MDNPHVLIVGAGPTGLVLALWLAKQGVKIRIIDKTSEPGTTSRALAVHARTLELYEQLDLTQAVLDKGHLVPGVNLWVEGQKRARLDFRDAGEGFTPFPFLHIFPQDEHERLLIERLAVFGIEVERQTELTGFTDEGNQVRATIQGPKGVETVSIRYLAGCDGARSTVREKLGAGFPGGTYLRTFYVADIEGSGPPIDGELHLDLDRADFLALFPLKGLGRARLIGAIRDTNQHPGELKFEDVVQRPIENLQLKIDKLNWFSTYRVHHRVTDHFRQGNIFLLGDAAHIHSPVGGQGMNTGIGDAINLAWKIKSVLIGSAPDKILNSYEHERIKFARQLVQTTDRAFTFVTADGPLAQFVRTRVVPVVLPALVSFDVFREWAFEAVSQVLITYRTGPLCGGTAGKVHGGDRLPWVERDGSSNYEALREPVWQAHVYGAAKPELKAWCDQFDIPLHVFAWSHASERVGLARDAFYLVRPDSYVFYADPSGLPDRAAKFLRDRDITLGLPDDVP